MIATLRFTPYKAANFTTTSKTLPSSPIARRLKRILPLSFSCFRFGRVDVCFAIVRVVKCRALGNVGDRISVSAMLEFQIYCNEILIVRLNGCAMVCNNGWNEWIWSKCLSSPCPALQEALATGARFEQCQVRPISRKNIKCRFRKFGSDYLTRARF